MRLKLAIGEALGYSADFSSAEQIIRKSELVDLLFEGMHFQDYSTEYEFNIMENIRSLPERILTCGVGIIVIMWGRNFLPQ